MPAASMIVSLLSPSPARHQPFALRNGSLLRLDRARGAVLRATSGRVWITEERRLRDVVLARGEQHRFESDGRALVVAERHAGVVLEWPSDREPPGTELARGEGQRGLCVAFARAWPAPIATLVAWWNARRADAAADPRPVPSLADRHSPDAVRDRLAAHEPFLRA